MALPYHVELTYPFTWPLPNISGVPPGGVKSRIRKDGTRRGPGDTAGLFLKPRAYTGRIALGNVVAAAPVTIYTYYPTPDDAIFPHMSATRYDLVPDSAEVLNKAYSKFIDDVRQGANAGVMVDLIEGTETLSMFGNVRRRITKAARTIEDAANTMAKAYRALRRGNLPRFAEALGITLKRKHRRAFAPGRGSRRIRKAMRRYSHQASGLWLEYHFGWSPLVSDIYESVGILSEDPVNDLRPVRGVSKRWFDTKEVRHSSGNYHREGRSSGSTIGVVRGWVRVSNPNFANNTRLGLNNPQTWLWEVIPFSFVLDWFSNVGQVLDSWSDLWGYHLNDASYTIYVKGVADGYYGYNSVAHVRWKFFNVFRGLGSYKPTLQVPKFSNFGHSVTRAATAVSLLISVFTGK